MGCCSAKDLLNQMNWRYATKVFDAHKKIPEEQFKTLKESLRLSASSFGLQPWKFIIVDSLDVRKQLKPVSWGQGQIEEASKLIVFCAKKHIDEAYIDRFLDSIVHARKIEKGSLKGYRDMMVGSLVQGGKTEEQMRSWASRQVYIAMGNLLTTAAMMGIDTCPIEGLDPVKYDEILKLSQTDYTTLAAVALGYRSETDKYQHLPKVRFKESEIFQTV